METVKTQDISTNDLNWKIEYDMDRCTMCGSCLATCTFQAIKADVIRIDKTTSDGLFPDPKHTHKAIPVIKQVKHLQMLVLVVVCVKKFVQMELFVQ